MTTIITRADIEQYVHATLPYHELSDWNVPAIIDEMVQRWPGICGHHPDLGTPTGALGGPGEWLIEHYIDSAEYWRIVAHHQTGPIQQTIRGEPAS